MSIQHHQILDERNKFVGGRLLRALLGLLAAFNDFPVDHTDRLHRKRSIGSACSFQVLA